jgi:hypothetical protein
MFIENIQWVLFTGLFITRIIDLISTYLVTPRLLNETNPVMRKFKWPSAWLTFLLCLIPFISIQIGICILVMSLLSSSLNIRKIWMMRAIGEEHYFEITKNCIIKSGVLKILFFEFMSAFFWILISLFLMLLIEFNYNNNCFWVALSFGAYGILTFIYYSIYLINLKKKYGDLMS